MDISFIKKTKERAVRSKSNIISGMIIAVERRKSDIISGMIITFEINKGTVIRLTEKIIGLNNDVRMHMDANYEPRSSLADMLPIEPHITFIV